MGMRDNRFKIVFCVQSWPSQRGGHSSVQVLSSLKKVLTQPPFQLAVTANDTTLHRQHRRTLLFMFTEESDFKLSNTLYLSSLLKEAVFVVGRGSFKSSLSTLFPIHNTYCGIESDQLSSE